MSDFDYEEPYGAAALRDIATEREKREAAEQDAAAWKRIAESMRDLAVEALASLILSDHARAKAKLIELCGIMPKT